MRLIILLFLATAFESSYAQKTPFELSNGEESATYFEAIAFYKSLAKKYPVIQISEKGPTDAGYQLHVVLISNDKKFDPVQWRKQNKIIIMINNGIHPGEPDGIDASMLLARDIAAKKINLPKNIALAIIPVYNIGGCLNRSSSSRVNQNGPKEYGFRGNSQNLDLNRDFTKCDSKEAKTFTKIFHWLQPHILVDNHVTDGADFQHVMTLISTQYEKLGGELGAWSKNTFDPLLYKSMSAKGWDMLPYLEFDNKGESDFTQFYDAPRYSSGYAAMFNTLSFIPETHMLKPFKQRVMATYDLLQTFITIASDNADSLNVLQAKANTLDKTRSAFSLQFYPDTLKSTNVHLKGYEKVFTTSQLTGQMRYGYDHSKPVDKTLKYFNSYIPGKPIIKPVAYIIPAGYYQVVDLLKLNNVKVEQLKNDSVMLTESYHIDDYKSYPTAYEKHHKNYDVKISSSEKNIKFLKGDFIVYMTQASNRYIMEMLEPTGDDSFFAWNFFDAILQQKEGYSDYRWEDKAAEVLDNDTVLKQKFMEKKQTDSAFSKSAKEQLNFIYHNSRFFESAYLNYPVYRVVNRSN